MFTFTEMSETTDKRLKIEEIFHTYGNLMFYAANQILHNDHDAEDAVQQALFVIYQNLEKFSEIKCPKSRSFIVTIVERKAIDLYRVKRRTAAIPFEDALIHTPAESSVDAAAELVDLASAITLLPPRYRQLLLLKYDNGYSEREIAVMCAMTESNVRKTIQRAKKQLKLILSEREA